MSDKPEPVPVEDLEVGGLYWAPIDTPIEEDEEEFADRAVVLIDKEGKKFWLRIDTVYQAKYSYQAGYVYDASNFPLFDKKSDAIRFGSIDQKEWGQQYLDLVERMEKAAAKFEQST